MASHCRIPPYRCSTCSNKHSVRRIALQTLKQKDGLPDITVTTNHNAFRTTRSAESTAGHLLRGIHKKNLVAMGRFIFLFCLVYTPVVLLNSTTLVPRYTQHFDQTLFTNLGHYSSGQRTRNGGIWHAPLALLQLRFVVSGS